MYLSTLMLTGQGGPNAENLPWYTKGVVLLTGVFSIGMFAIPASMVSEQTVLYKTFLFLDVIM